MVPQLDITELQRLTIVLHKNVQWTTNRASVWKKKKTLSKNRLPRETSYLYIRFVCLLQSKRSQQNDQMYFQKHICVWINDSVLGEWLWLSNCSMLVFDNLWMLIELGCCIRCLWGRKELIKRFENEEPKRSTVVDSKSINSYELSLEVNKF